MSPNQAGQALTSLNVCLTHKHNILLHFLSLAHTFCLSSFLATCAFRTLSSNWADKIMQRRETLESNYLSIYLYI